jgi:hypothetical protein
MLKRDGYNWADPSARSLEGKDDVNFHKLNEYLAMALVHIDSEVFVIALGVDAKMIYVVPDITKLKISCKKTGFDRHHPNCSAS